MIKCNAVNLVSFGRWFYRPIYFFTPERGIILLMNGAEAIITSLRKEGVKVVFGYPGGAVLTLYDAVYQMDFPHILTRHEQGAVHAADGYARSTGKVGVAFATSGPGATNLVTGIATAYIDSIPLVCITGQVGNPYIGKDSFQEADIVGITTPITKHNYLVKRVEDLPRVLKEAFYIARTGRPGPVVIDVAKDVFAAKIDYSYPETVNLKGYRGESRRRNRGSAGRQGPRTGKEALALYWRRRHPLRHLKGDPPHCGPHRNAGGKLSDGFGLHSRRRRSFPGDGGNARLLCGQHCHDGGGSRFGYRRPL